jgi:Acetyltransferase (GNAT) family
MVAQSQALMTNENSVVIRRATPADAAVCGKICFEAFGSLASHHNFPLDFPAPEVPIGILSTMFSHPGFFCVVAEHDQKIIGSNCLDERSPIAGVGPITIDPAVQNRLVGRQLMQAVLVRAAQRKFAGTRLCRRRTTIVHSRYTQSSVSSSANPSLV